MTATKWECFSRRLLEPGCGQHLSWSTSCAEMWELYTLQKAWARSVVVEVEKERQNVDKASRWQQETPYKEELAHADVDKCNSETNFFGSQRVINQQDTFMSGILRWISM